MSGAGIWRDGGIAYGGSLPELEQINVPAVHELGLTGDGVVLGMLDTGWKLTHDAFAGLDVLAAYDFVQDDQEVANEPGEPSGQHNHGTFTLSAIAGFADGALVGPAFGASVLPLQLLAAAAWVDAVSGISANVLTMTGHQKPMARVIMASQLVNIVLTLLLVRRYGIGGVALASLIASILAAVATLALAVHHLDAAPWRTYGSTLASVGPCGIMLFAISVLRWAFTRIGAGRITLLQVAILELIGCVVFFAAFYAIGCSARERAYYREKATCMLQRRRQA